MPDSNHQYAPLKNATKVAFVILLVIATSGFFMGLRQTATLGNSRDLAQIAALDHHEESESHDTPQARGYTEMRRLPKSNQKWTNLLAKLVEPQVDLFATNQSFIANRAAALDERKQIRAFDGAPPTIPHPIDQTSAASCLSCHGEGKVIRDRIAAKISHPHYSNCTQCHVPTALSAMPEAEHLKEPLAENEFRGLESFGKGIRAFEGAPPTIPHPASLRTDCMSCHGPKGSVGLRTPHPWRQSCTQCHVPSAEINQQELDTHSFMRRMLESAAQKTP